MSKRDVTQRETGHVQPHRRKEQPLMPWLPTLPLLSLSYTVTELTVAEGQARVRGFHGRLEDGRLRTEHFDALLGPEAFAEAAQAFQAQMLDCMRLMQAPLRAFFPLMPDLVAHRQSREYPGPPGQEQ